MALAWPFSHEPISHEPTALAFHCGGSSVAGANPMKTRLVLVPHIAYCGSTVMGIATERAEGKS